jgi:hypothetical protein
MGELQCADQWPPGSPRPPAVKLKKSAPAARRSDVADGAGAADAVLAAFAWSASRKRLLRDMHPAAERLLSDVLDPMKRTLKARTDETFFLGDGLGPEPVLPEGQWQDYLEELHRGLITVQDGLATMPAPAALPDRKPPTDAKLREHVAKDAITEDLITFVTRADGLRRAAAAGPRPTEFDREWRLDGRLLDEFLTVAVRDRFHQATAGFPQVAGWGAEDITRGSQSILYLAYVTIALDYLSEVLKLMPDYADASGQGTTRDLGEVISALKEAIQNDPALTAEDRDDLLVHADDIGEAVSGPVTHQPSGNRVDEFPAIDADERGIVGAPAAFHGFVEHCPDHTRQMEVEPDAVHHADLSGRAAVTDRVAWSAAEATSSRPRCPSWWMPSTSRHSRLIDWFG